MRILIDGLNEFYSENVRLVRTLMQRESEKEYPVRFKWKLQMLYFSGSSWIEICRIDNYLHDNICKSHIHVLKRKDVQWADLDFTSADKEIKYRSAKLLKDRFNTIVNFEVSK